MIYDLIILGGGPAGYLAAQRAGHEGLNVLLFEGKNLGGVCLNEGCVPSKTLLNSAKIYDYARQSEKYGITVQEVQYDHNKVIQRKEKVVKTLVAGIKSGLKKYKVTVVNQFGKITGKSDKGYLVGGEDKEYSCKNLLIATGSESIIPPIPGVKEGFESGFVLTNREILSLDKVPESLVIVGGGVIGLEMASYYNSIGCKVTIVEMLNSIGGPIDKEISEILKKNYEKKGIAFKLNTKVTAINKNGVKCENGEKSEEINAQKVLLSIGRRPVVKDIGLENIGIQVENGKLETDQYGRTNIPNVYGAGDVNGKSMLAHTAYREAEVCINNILGKKDLMRYNAIPSVIYTNPEVASVGETQESATKKGIQYKVANLSMNYSGRYAAENEKGDGICKVLVDAKYNKIIGIHLIGSYASEIIYGAAIMIETQMRIKDIKEIVFPHPTVSEIIREGIFQI